MTSTGVVLSLGLNDSPWSRSILGLNDSPWSRSILGLNDTPGVVPSYELNDYPWSRSILAMEGHPRSCSILRLNDYPWSRSIPSVCSIPGQNDSPRVVPFQNRMTPLESFQPRTE